VRQRLAEQAGDAAIERQRSAEIEASAELLRTISDVLDIRTVFPRVSDIAKKMLPHDALAMVFVDRDRHFVRQAASPVDFADPPQVTTKAPMPKEIIIDDLSTGLVALEPADAFGPVVAAGYRSLLSVRIPAREQVLELVFWSKRPAAFKPSDCSGGGSDRGLRRALGVARTASRSRAADGRGAGTRRAARSSRRDALAGTRLEDSRGWRIGRMARRPEEGNTGG
jgi:hypothetical protein